MWQIPKIWQGGDVWIIGGGPSITEQFKIPANIVEQVRNYEKPITDFSRYMKPIHGKHTIGVNVAFMLGKWIDIAFFGDHSFFLKNENELSQFKGIRISCDPGIHRVDWIKYVPRDPKKRYGISDNPSTVSWNMNSGAAAISIAVNAGAKRVFLLGFDMTLIDNQQHWHNRYRPNGQRAQTLPFTAHLRGFNQISFDAHRKGIEIYNVSPNSKIQEFEKLTLQQALNK